MNRRLTFLSFALVVATLLSTGCSIKSYPADYLEESIQKICRKEYGIDHVEVKVSGNTIGVYLPLKQLFATDFKESVVSGKVRNLETLFEPSEDALEQVEDVLFTISRVLLSTDKDFEFYILQATDVENTGLQLILKGFVNDVKRVRIWDISRGEYRKRVIHEMRQNRAVVWHRPIRHFIQDLSLLDIDAIQEKYFGRRLPADVVQSLFFNRLNEVGDDPSAVTWEIHEMRSARIRKGQVLVYVDALPRENGLAILPEGVHAKYLFMVNLEAETPRIIRIIPFQYVDEWGEFKEIPFPEDIRIENSLDTWEEEFPLESIDLGDFLAEQLTRRLQGGLAMDERIQNTFREVKVQMNYLAEEGEEPHFQLEFSRVSLRDFNNYNLDSMIFHEDMIYLLEQASREIVDVLRSYSFGDYNYLSLNIAQEPDSWILQREDLEMIRRDKADLQGLLALIT